MKKQKTEELLYKNSYVAIYGTDNQEDPPVLSYYFAKAQRGQTCVEFSAEWRTPKIRMWGASINGPVEIKGFRVHRTPYLLVFEFPGVSVYNIQISW